MVGDARILRFLRGKQLDVEVASDMYIKFLKWRRENNVDQIRQEIAPQIVITRNALDKLGRPIGKSYISRIWNNFLSL